MRNALILRAVVYRISPWIETHGLLINLLYLIVKLISKPRIFSTLSNSPLLLIILDCAKITITKRLAIVARLHKISLALQRDLRICRQVRLTLKQIVEDIGVVKNVVDYVLPSFLNSWLVFYRSIFRLYLALIIIFLCLIHHLNWKFKLILLHVILAISETLVLSSPHRLYLGRQFIVSGELMHWWLLPYLLLIIVGLRWFIFLFVIVHLRWNEWPHNNRFLQRCW